MTEQPIDLSQLASIRDGSGHSIFGASGSPMFLNCAGSLIPNLLVKDEPNEDSAYGTVAHEISEQWLKTGVKPEHRIGEIVEVGPFKIEIDEVMLDYTQQTVDRCSLEPGVQLVEEHVDYSDLTPIPNQGGTLDFAAMREGVAMIHDHKFGKAHIVYAKQNTQLMLYAYGIYKRYGWLFDFKRFVLRIAQPRIDHYDEWECTVEELLEFVEWAKLRMYASWDVNAARTAGEKQCTWCKVRIDCAAHAKMQVDLCEGIFTVEDVSPEQMEDFKDRLGETFGPLTLRNVEAGSLTTEHLVNLFKMRRAAIRYWEAIEKELFRRTQNGETLHAYGKKIVEGRAIRFFKNVEAAKDRLLSLGLERDQVVQESIVSPAQAEVLLKKIGRKQRELPELLDGLIGKPPGKPTIADLSDSRPEIVDLGKLVFDDETTSETDEL